MVNSEFYTPTFPPRLPPDSAMADVVTGRPLTETRFPRTADEFGKNYHDLRGRSPSKRIDRSRSRRQHRISASIRPPTAPTTDAQTTDATRTPTVTATRTPTDATPLETTDFETAIAN